MSDLFFENTIKGEANREITVNFALRLSEMLGDYILKDSSCAKKVIICKDTRISGYMLESALCAGLCSKGINVLTVGVVPSCAMSALVKKYRADMAVSVTASDLPAKYNGFRIFKKDGTEADSEFFAKLKSGFDSPESAGAPESATGVGKVRRLHTALRDYVDYVKGYSSLGLSGIKVAIDCANGSGFECAKIIFSERGAHVEVMNNSPDGENINLGCGALNPDELKRFVVSHKCDMGIALNGDGSVAVLIDDKGEILEQKAARKAFGISDDADVAQGCLAIAGYLADSGRKLSEVKR